MKVNAFVVEGSHPVKGWESRRKVSGQLAGVRFFKQGRTFVAFDLSPEDVEKVRHNRFVKLEIQTSSPASPPVAKPEPTPDPPAPPAPAPEPPAKKVDPLMAAFGPVVKRRGRKPKSLT